MAKYSGVSSVGDDDEEWNDSSYNDDSKSLRKQTTDDNISIASTSSKRRFGGGRRRINSELSEPLTATSIVDEELGEHSDPYFVFRSDLQNKLEQVDEALAEYLRVVHETVRTVHIRIS